MMKASSSLWVVGLSAVMRVNGGYTATSESEGNKSGRKDVTNALSQFAAKNLKTVRAKMMNKLSQPPVKWTGWPIAMSIFVVTLIVYAFYFNYSEPLKDLAGELEILDMRGSGYELTDARELLDFLGEEGQVAPGHL